MTIDEVKRDLPQVQVMFNGKVRWAKVSGRLNNVATVSVGYSSTLAEFVDFHFSWEAVARSVNSGEPLTV